MPGPLQPTPLQPHPEKYGHVERERRFLLRRLPPGLTLLSECRQITDHYFPDTALRLRHISDAVTGKSLWKLTQKLRADPADGACVFTTTLYLSEQEHAQFLTPQAHQIRKDRYPFDYGGRRYGIDVFQNDLLGLFLAETECDPDEELQGIMLPDFAACDVSHQQEFTGGALAALTPSTARAWLERLWEAGILDRERREQL